jgi:protein kinase A
MVLLQLEDIMHKKVETYDATTGAAEDAGKEGGKEEKQFDAMLPASEVPARKDLKVIGTLGKGSFGHVQLVKHKKSGMTYALKSVSKAQIVETCQQSHIISEKQTMAKLNSPFLIRLYATYKDKNQLYFLLEPSLGGELFTVLRKRKLFSDSVAAFYAASVVLGFEYMHSLDIVYRDLKPENLLLDKNGHLKITDFGFAKVLKGRTWTLCGTPDYLAPEIVQMRGHGKGVDWWTLGILIFEMLASYPPFFDEDPMKTYSKILHNTPKFPGRWCF